MVFLSVIALTTVMGDDPVDSIKKKLTKAEETHRLELAKAQSEVIKWLDGREASARKKGDKATVNTVKQQREKLETEGTIPKPIPVNTSRKVDTARDLLDASYASLLKEALIAKLDDLADEIEDKRVQLTKEKADINVFRQVRHMAKNMVVNGSFEFPEVPNGVKTITDKINGWNDKSYTIAKYPAATPVHGEQMLEMGGASQITQVVNGFVIGERYVVTVYAGTYASPLRPNVALDVTASIAGEKQTVHVTAVSSPRDPYAMTGTKAKWEAITIVFKALGEEHELTIENPGLQTVVIDQVSIIPYLGN